MRRIMILGQPGAGKSWLAREIGARTGLPVVHMDHIHWQSGWVERPIAEKLRLARAVEAGEAWIFEGGLSATYASRAARADLILWLDPPFALRVWRVIRRNLLWWGRNRPDLPEGCCEDPRNLPGFLQFIWRSRHSAARRIAAVRPPPGVPLLRLRSRREVAAFLQGLPGK